MTGVDIKEFATLWQEEPTPEERSEFRGLADKAARKAQFVQYAEHGLGLLLAMAVLAAVMMKPAPATILIGGLSIAALSWSSWRRHLLCQVALLVATSDREDLVRLARIGTEANLKHSTVGLWLFLPGVLAGALLTEAVVEDGDISSFGSDMAMAAVTWPGPLFIVLLMAALLHLVRQNLRLRSEVERLEALGRDYREEARLDAGWPAENHGRAAADAVN